MDEYVDPMRAICMGLPEVEEGTLPNGHRWIVRRRPIAYLVSVDGPDGEVIVCVFRSQPPELAALQNAGHPFFSWGTSWIGMVIDDHADWAEVGELIADSYCITAPKKLAAQVSP